MTSILLLDVFGPPTGMQTAGLPMLGRKQHGHEVSPPAKAMISITARCPHEVATVHGESLYVTNDIRLQYT